MQLVESVPLLTNSKANGFVGVNLYCDDTGQIKQLPVNVRATDMARCCGHAIEVRRAKGSANAMSGWHVSVPARSALQHSKVCWSKGRQARGTSGLWMHCVGQCVRTAVVVANMRWTA